VKQKMLQGQSQRYGGTGGTSFDDVSSSGQPIVGIKAIWIRHGNQVDSVQAKYLLADGSTVVSDRHGGSSGTNTHIEFGDGESIKEIRGKTNNALVDQLTFITENSSGVQKTYGPYGRTGRTPFTVKGEIFAFYGRSGNLLDSIGIYYFLQKSQLWGGNGGSTFDDKLSLPSSPTRINEIWVRHGNQIDSLKASYALADGSTTVSDVHGGTGGSESHVTFEDGEVITEVKGKTGGRLVDQLSFITTTSTGAQKVYGPYGKTGHTHFSLQGEILAFYGRSGNLLDSIGFYHK
jgi:hypothetical protein